jgi:hypothetical protein
MLTWFSNIIPSEWIFSIGPIILLIVGHLVEKKYVGRMTIFTNTMAINIFFFSKNVPELFVWYANIGLILGIISLFSYYYRSPMPTWMYTVAMIYSSIPIGLIMWYFTINPLLPPIVTNSTMIS